MCAQRDLEELMLRPKTCLYAFGLMATCTAAAMASFTNNILITGYWPPTNEMVRHFSTSPVQNPAGWEGENWESRGYDIHSYFPEFVGGVDANPKGDGDLEVDYQDTSEDWWRITSEINPVAIITFSRGNADASWELEYLQRNLGSRGWNNDFEAPFDPTPSPPDSSVPLLTERPSTLPMEDIVSAVTDADLGVDAYVDYTGYGGAFVSEFIAYHGVWYQDLHKDASDPFQSVAAGHVHVGIDVTVDQGRLATEASLRVLLDHVDALLVPEPGSMWVLLVGALAIVSRRRNAAPAGGGLPIRYRATV